MALTRITKGVIKPNENYDTHNINSTGIVTAVGADFSGNVSVGGVLTYEDVTSIDSVGIITARNGIDCNSDLDVDGHTNLDNVSVAGITTFSGIIDAINTPASIRVAQDIQHKGDADTKISFPANDTFTVETNGSERLRILSDGNVGIGSENPNKKLSIVTGSNLGISLINDTTFATSGIYLEGGRNAGTGVVGQLQFYNRRNGGLTSNLKVNGDGNFHFDQSVGIGTNDPQKTLNVFAGVGTTELIRLSHPVDASTQQEIGIGWCSNNDHTYPAAQITSQEYDVSDSRGSLVFYTRGTNSDIAPTERLRINSDGKVLIGSDTHRNVSGGSASGQLQVEGTSANTSSLSLISNQASDNSASLHFGKTRGTSTGAVTAVADGDNLGSIRFSGADGTDLNNATATMEAVVNGTVGNNQIPTDIIFKTSLTSGSNRSEKLRITSAGKIGIGTDNPSQELTLYGTDPIFSVQEATASSQVDIGTGTVTGFINIQRADGTRNVQITANGDSFFTGGNVGIGTALPVIPLHIDGAADSDMVLLDTLTPGNYSQVRGLNNSGIRVRGGGSYGGGMIDLGGGLRGTDPGVIKFHSGTDVTANNPEHMRIQANGEIAMKSGSTHSVTDALANLHVQNGTFMVSQANGVGTEYTKITTHTHSQDNDRHMFTGVSNGIVRSMIRKDGAVFIASSYTAGRTRSDQNSPTNYYFNGPFGFNAYSGRTDDSNNYRTIAYIRAWDGGDTGDRNVIYYADSGSDTTTNDYDQHQKFGVKANGMAQFGSNVFAGRVESDEGSPNSVYTGVTGTSIITYPNSGSQWTRIDARTTDNTDRCIGADTGGGLIFKVESSGRVESDGGFHTPAQDYAEYFEWTDGNTSNADRRGISVVMDGEKIRPATDSDDKSKIIGVVSGQPSVVGDAAWSEWQLAHLKDGYGSFVTEDKEYLVWNKFGTFTDTDGVKKPNPQPNINDYNRDADHQILVSEIEAEKAKGNVPQAAIDQNLRVTKASRVYNPDYDRSRDYVPRSHRKEWDAIGLLGKLSVRRGQPIGANWILMKSNVGVDPNDNSIVLDKYLVR